MPIPISERPTLAIASWRAVLVLHLNNQVKTFGNCFYGSFTGNRATFDRSTANNDPIFSRDVQPRRFPRRRATWSRNSGTSMVTAGPISCSGKTPTGRY